MSRLRRGVMILGSVRLGMKLFSSLSSLSRAAILIAVSWPASAGVEEAVAYLASEVTNWPQNNRCFSCHNNGDGARVLYIAVARGLPVKREALATTSAWLREPARWSGESPGGPTSDPKLATIQYAAALIEAREAGIIQDQATLLAAGALLLAHQDSSGCWKIAGDGAGSPATYGTALATYMAARTLAAIDETRYEKPISRAKQWIQTTVPVANVDRASKLLLLGADDDSVALLLKGQTGEGGWGLYPGTPAENFDTAIVLLALRNNAPSSGAAAQAISRGRAYLLKSQAGAGWPETTRPSGNQSYAQHISTTAWVIQALLATSNAPAPQ